MIIGGKEFDTDNDCYIMGILNVTPDSFSDGGKWNNLDNALSHAQNMIKSGASIIDVGGESSRPGHERISIGEELDRTIPIIEALCDSFDVPISIDTCKSGVAEAAIKAGASLVNDIWGLKSDTEMARVVAEAKLPCCLMHNRTNAEYNKFLPDMIADLKESVAIAKKSGIAEDKIILDPGIGFAKTHEMNLEAINCLDAIVQMGYPVLLGASRKRVVGNTLDLPVDERVEGSVAAAVIGFMRGCAFIRVHDVKETFRAIKMARSIVSAGI